MQAGRLRYSCLEAFSDKRASLLLTIQIAILTFNPLLRFLTAILVPCLPIKAVINGPWHVGKQSSGLPR
jgi:hypothetical protein